MYRSHITHRVLQCILCSYACLKLYNIYCRSRAPGMGPMPPAAPAATPYVNGNRLEGPIFLGLDGN